MSKKYDRELKEVDRLIKENRELKSQIRQLHKKLKTLNKGYSRLEELEETAKYEDVQKIVEESIKLCYECNGRLIIKELPSINRYFRECDGCGKRTKTKTLSA